MKNSITNNKAYNNAYFGKNAEGFVFACANYTGKFESTETI
jgi:hypothetical protein